ncbi:lipid II flippase MurJ [Streptomyces sp. NPDC059740]|uniref:lipid II flippase MurJ n=1 Tax=Streptomyces sp. NPDC059740 TaxID=3346926 RepID=UPI003657D62F
MTRSTRPDAPREAGHGRPPRARRGTPPPAGRPTAAPVAAGGRARGAGLRPATGGTAAVAETGRLGRHLARAAAVTAVLTAAGSLFGLVRDQTIARFFGAGGDTDAFLVAWTVPETAATLLIEDAMALVLIPAFSLALSRRATSPQGTPGTPPGPDPVRALVAATLPRLLAVLVCAAALLALLAPQLVAVLAPGLREPATAVDCTRLTSLTVVGFGLAGYFSAALRAHRSFLAPAAIYVTYNLGIVALMVAGHVTWGVRSAAVGVAVGAGLMALVQLPPFWRHLRRAPRPAGATLRRAAARAPLLGAATFVPVVSFALTRQAQVLVERHLGSALPPGAISHLNYAQKIAQMPMVLSLMVVTVTFPVVARAVADGDAVRARRRVERDLALAAAVVLVGAAYVVACAPQIVQLLFQRGAFGAADTAATASVMRVYACGLLGHSLTGALVRPFFSASRPTWYPALAMAAGLLVTVAVGRLSVHHLGVHGIAAANALGITTTALLLLRGLGSRVVAVRVRAVAGSLARLVGAAVPAAGAGWAVGLLSTSPLTGAAAGAAAVLVTFACAATALGAPQVPELFATVKRRLVHAR